MRNLYLRLPLQSRPSQRSPHVDAVAHHRRRHQNVARPVRKVPARP